MKEFISDLKLKDALEGIGTIAAIDNSIYYYLPFWFKKTDKEGVYEVFSMANVPSTLKELLKNIRNEPPQRH